MATQDEMLAGLLGGIPGGPLTQGLLATSAGLLSAGGPSYEPRSFGSALGAGMMSGLNAYQQAQQNSLAQYATATKLAQQMRQQQALAGLTANMSPEMRNLAIANPEAFTKTLAENQLKLSEFRKDVQDFAALRLHPDPIVREAAFAQLANKTPAYRAMVEAAVTEARESAQLPFVGPAAAAAARGSFYGVPQRFGDSLIMIPAPGAPLPQPGGDAPGAPAVPGAPAGQPGAPRVVYSAPRDPEKTASMEDTVRQNFVKMPEVANYKEVVSAFNSATTAGNTLAGDLNIVYAFAKAMDPASVVREGEQVMIQRTGGVFDRLKGMVDSINGGARLTPEIRMALMNELNTRVLSLQQQHDSVRAQYEALARQRGLNVDNVIDKAPTINLPFVRSQADVDRLTPGQMYRDHQGNLRIKS